MRGVITRGFRERGQQEHDLAKRMREAAGRIDAWPRTRTLLLRMADEWEDFAKRELLGRMPVEGAWWSSLSLPQTPVVPHIRTLLELGRHYSAGLH